MFNLAFILFFSPFRRLLIRFFHLHEEHYNTKSLHFSSHFVCLLVCLLGLLLVCLLLGFYSVVYFASLFIWFSGMNSILLGLCIIIIFVCLFLPKFDTSFFYFCCLLVVACGGEAARRSVTRRIYASLRSIDSIERTLYYWKYRKKNNKHYQRKSENKERTQFNRNLRQTRVTIAYTLHYESERGRDNWRAISTIEFEQLKFLLLY